jgi:hypothetical protein
MSRAMLRSGRVPLPVGRAGFKPVGGRFGVLGRFDSCLFRHFSFLLLSVDCGFSQETFAGTRGNAQDAPTAAIRLATIGRLKSTRSGHS